VGALYKKTSKKGPTHDVGSKVERMVDSVGEAGAGGGENIRSTKAVGCDLERLDERVLVQPEKRTIPQARLKRRPPPSSSYHGPTAPSHNRSQRDNTPKSSTA
jgi:hypothetical protein